MSALTYINEYGSNSEESESELENKHCHRTKLPAPNLNKVSVVSSYEHKDNPELHGGRTRCFPHVRGNWPSYAFVQYIDVDLIDELLHRLEERISTKVGSSQRCNDIHISLSKTVVLNYHMISSFNSSLQKALNRVESFDLGFTAIKIYCNDEKTRTFISLEVEPFTEKFLLEITRRIDEILREFRLPTFYEDPSFHMSVLWMNGDKKLELDSIVESLNDILVQELDKSLKTVIINSINCKIGNKFFKYSLS